MTLFSFKSPKGWVNSHGFYFDNSISEQQVKIRILELWSDQSKLFRINDCYILLEPNIKHVFVEKSLGSPLIRQFGVLSNVILNASNEIPITSNVQNFILAKSGSLQKIELNNELTFDPSVWINLSNYHEQITDTLGFIKKPQIKKKLHKITIRETLNEASLQDSPELKQTLKNLDKVSQGEYKTGSSRGIGFGVFFSGLRRIFQVKGFGTNKYSSNMQSQHNHPHDRENFQNTGFPEYGISQEITRSFF